MRLPITGDQPAILPSAMVTGPPEGEGQPTAPSKITSAWRQRSSDPGGQSRPCSRVVLAAALDLLHQKVDAGGLSEGVQHPQTVGKHLRTGAVTRQRNHL